MPEQTQFNPLSILPNSMPNLEEKIADFTGKTGLDRTAYPLLFSTELSQLMQGFSKGDRTQSIRSKRGIRGTLGYTHPQTDEDFVDSIDDLVNDYRTNALPAIASQFGDSIRGKALEPIYGAIDKTYKEVDEEKDDKKKKALKESANEQIAALLYQLASQINPDNKYIKGIQEAQAIMEGKGDPSVLEGMALEMFGERRAPLLFQQMLKSREGFASLAQMYQRVKMKEFTKSLTEDGKISKTKVDTLYKEGLDKNPQGYEALVANIYAANSQEAH